MVSLNEFIPAAAAMIVIRLPSLPLGELLPSALEAPEAITEVVIREAPVVIGEASVVIEVAPVIGGDPVEIVPKVVVKPEVTSFNLPVVTEAPLLPITEVVKGDVVKNGSVSHQSGRPAENIGAIVLL